MFWDQLTKWFYAGLVGIIMLAAGYVVFTAEAGIVQWAPYVEATHPIYNDYQGFSSNPKHTRSSLFECEQVLNENLEEWTEEFKYMNYAQVIFSCRTVPVDI